MANLSERIKNLRNLLGVSQGKFAELIDITRPNLAFIETGKTTPSFDVIKKIHTVLDVDTDYFFSDDEDILPGGYVTNKTWSVATGQKVGGTLIFDKEVISAKDALPASHNANALAGLKKEEKDMLILSMQATIDALQQALALAQQQLKAKNK